MERVVVWALLDFLVHLLAIDCNLLFYCSVSVLDMDTVWLYDFAIFIPLIRLTTYLSLHLLIARYAHPFSFFFSPSSACCVYG